MAKAVQQGSYTESKLFEWTFLLHADSIAHKHSPSLNCERPCMCHMIVLYEHIAWKNHIIYNLRKESRPYDAR